MINSQALSDQRFHVVNHIHQNLSHLPLDSYFKIIRFHSVVARYPLETLLLGRSINCEDYRDRIRPWIEKTLATSPYLNN